MITYDNLPVLLVSAANETLAASIISELIDNDVTEEYIKAALSSDRVWRLVNKYYSADVKVHVLTDDSVLDLDTATIEAHIIYISEDEIGEGVGCAERRVAAACGAWSECDVRVLLLDAAGGDWPAGGAGGAWGSWAAAARAELVPRRELAPTDVPAPEPFADAYGMERARAALHAHPWPNLMRTDGQPQAPPITHSPHPLLLELSDDELDVQDEDVYSDMSSDDDSNLGWEPAESESDDDERFAVEHAEAFAAALGALGADARDEPPPGAPRDARLDRAEDLVAAFCRALGLDPDSA